MAGRYCTPRTPFNRIRSRAHPAAGRRSASRIPASTRRADVAEKRLEFGQLAHRRELPQPEVHLLALLVDRRTHVVEREHLVAEVCGREISRRRFGSPATVAADLAHTAPAPVTLR
jgi:DNA-binding response OmpR family regulator